VLGTITLFVGTMQALKQEQSKRLLAFHSIGQVGYILLGLGACVALLPGSPSVASLGVIALFGALFHTVNHALFKSLLFLNAGSMLYATGTQNLNKMGGLMKYMPATAILTLIASFSIAGVPLFNGFASKWSIYVATILGGREYWFLALCAVVALLTSVLTLASFMKFFGMSFLSRASSGVIKKAQAGSLEGNWLMLTPQALLAALCVGLGVLPGIAYALFNKALTQSEGGLSRLFHNVLDQKAFADISGTYALGNANAGMLLMPVVLLAVLVVLYVLAVVISKLGGAERRVSEPWLCGYSTEHDQNRYSAHHLYTEFKRYFHWLGGKPKKVVEAGEPPVLHGGVPPVAAREPAETGSK
jgi:hydrogenase-4 component B